MPDIRDTIRGLSQSELQIFKRQLAGLPENDRQRAYQRLAGLPEFSDVLGREPQEEVEGRLPSRPKQVQPRQPEPSLGQIFSSKEVPLWQKGLAGFGAPFQFIQEKAIEPFASAVTSPFTPSVEGTEGMGWLQRERAEYEQWDDPNLGFLGVKGAVEFLPWLAIPGIGGVVGKGGLAARKGVAGALGRLGTAGKVAGTALEYSPWGLAEKVTGKAIGYAGKGVGKLLSQKIEPAAKKITSELFPDGFSEEQTLATRWLTNLVGKSKPLTKETLALRVPEHAARAAEYSRLLEEKVGRGMPLKRALREASEEALQDRK